MNVGDLMRRRFDSIGPGAPVAEAVRTMLLTGQEALPVVEDGRLVGMIAERDVFERLLGELSSDAYALGLLSVDFDDLDAFRRLGSQPVAELMSTRLVTATPRMPALRAVAVMRARRIRRLPVIEGERIVGLLLQADVLAELLRRAVGPSSGRSGAGARPPDLPVLLLTTKGRKSGRPRTRALMFLEDGGSFVVVASNPGRGAAPAWWLNLQSDPRATVRVGGTTVSVVAERAGPEVRARLWPSIVRMNPPYEELQRRAGPELPVVVLRPVHAIAGAPSGWGPAEAAGARPGRR